MAKANAEATAKRVDHLQGMILASEPNTACLTYARQTWGSRAGVSVAQKAGSDKGRHRGIWNRPSGAAELVNPDAYGHDWSSDEAKQSWAVVGAIRQLDHMMGTGYNSHRSGGIRR